MKLCSYYDTVYNLDKFIGVEVTDNSSDDIGNEIAIIFRFEGDYQQSTDEQIPYSFAIYLSDSLLEARGININKLENKLENGIYAILQNLASEFVERFRDELKEISIDDDCIIDLKYIEYKIINEIENFVK